MLCSGYIPGVVFLDVWIFASVGLVVVAVKVVVDFVVVDNVVVVETEVCLIVIA